MSVFGKKECGATFDAHRRRGRRRREASRRLQWRSVSTWKLAKGGLQRKWQGIKQRTAWRFKTLKDKNTLIVFSADHQKEKEVHIKPRNQQIDDPLACHNVLARVSAASLNGILGATSPEDSSQFVKTMTGFMLHACSPAMRAQILDVITRQRLEEISITNRAVIIRAIQHCLLSPLHTEKAVLHTAACNVLRGTYGKDLTLLKDQVHTSDELLACEQSIDPQSSSVDESQQVRELQQRQNSSSDITIDEPLRDDTAPAEEPPHSGDLSHLIFENKNLTEVVQVMQHIAVEALKVKQDAPNLVKVVSDIDDTLFPGIEKLPPSITFLTARPRGWLSVGRYMTVQHLKSLGIPNATVLNGSVKGLVSSKKIASLKLENFTRFAALYPEFQFVFFGDSGQGDALLASKLLHAFPDRVLGTFIHDVTPGSSTTGDGQQKAIYQAEGVDFFSTYAGAALAAHQKQLITKRDLVDIVAIAERELDTLRFLGPQGDTMKQARRRELSNDAEQVLRHVESAKADGCARSPRADAASVAGTERECETMVHANALVPNAKQSLFGATRLVTPLGRYPHAVLRDEDVVLIETSVSDEQLRALLRKDTQPHGNS
ncbi:hypothetical protein FI667_g15145, partial [Globisporangium splendens]